MGLASFLDGFAPPPRRMIQRQFRHHSCAVVTCHDFVTAVWHPDVSSNSIKVLSELTHWHSLQHSSGPCQWGSSRYSQVLPCCKGFGIWHFLPNQKSIINNQRNQFLSFVVKVLPINNQSTNSETDTATNQAAELLLGFLGFHLQRCAGPTQHLTALATRHLMMERGQKCHAQDGLISLFMLCPGTFETVLLEAGREFSISIQELVWHCGIQTGQRPRYPQVMKACFQHKNPKDLKDLKSRNSGGSRSFFLIWPSRWAWKMRFPLNVMLLRQDARVPGASHSANLLVIDNDQWLG